MPQPPLKKPDSPPELDELLKKALSFITGKSAKRKDDSSSHSNSPKSEQNDFDLTWGIAGLIFAVLAVLWVVAGIFVVSPAQRAVVLRFGQYTETVGPGPHWIPAMIDSEQKVNVQQVSNFNYSAEMLTTDENIVSVSLAVQYRIDFPKNYLFNVVDPVESLQQATASALRQVIGQTTLDDVLTTGRAQVRDEVAQLLNKMLVRYKTGILVTDVTLQPAKPPEEVTSAFDDAIKAREDEQRYINQAQAYAKKVIPVAQGQASRLTQEAQAYKTNVVLNAKANVASFLSILPEYQLAPVVTKDRIYLDAMQAVFGHSSKIFIDAKNGHNMLYLPLNQIMQAEKSATKQSAVPNNNVVQHTAMTQLLPSNSNDQGLSYPAHGGDV